jgi:UDP-glucose 4-epimerase
VNKRCGDIAKVSSRDLLNTESSKLNTRRYVLVTGAYGFLGRHVARLFAQKGSTVVGIGHGQWSRVEWESWGMSTWHQADVTLAGLELYAGCPSVIVHCAGSGSVFFSVENPLADFERTVATTANVLEYVRRYAPSCRIVYPSSASIYGAVETVPIREDCRAAPISQYGVHKLMAEQMVVSYARQFETSAAIVRLFSVYGCGLRKQLLWDACHKFANKDTVFMGTGEEVRDWLHVDDAAELLLVAAEHASSACPTINGGTGQGATVRDVLVHLRNSLHLGNLPTPTFSGAQRVGDPNNYVAHIGSSQAWAWQPTRHWKAGVAEYAAWWTRHSR